MAEPSERPADSHGYERSAYGEGMPVLTPSRPRLANLVSGIWGMGHRLLSIRRRAAQAVTEFLFDVLPVAPGIFAPLVIVGAVDFLIGWTAVWLLLWWLDPHLLVATSAGLTVLFQVVAAVIVAIYVLVVGAVFVMAQLLVSNYGGRAAMLLAEDERVVFSVLRPLLVLIPAVLLAGQVPDGGQPPDVLTAAAGALALAAGMTALSCASSLVVATLQFTGTRSIMLKAVEPLNAGLHTKMPAMVRWRTPMLAQGGQLALRRGDSATFNVALEGIGRIVEGYMDYAAAGSPVRGYEMADEDYPFAYYGWAVLDAADALHRLAEDAFRQNAPTVDGDAPVSALEYLAHEAIRRGLLFEAHRLTRSLVALGCSSHQVLGGFENLLSRPVGCLGRLEAHFEAAGAGWFAAYTLAGWGLCVSYFDAHFVNDPAAPLGRHPLWDTSIASFGPTPRWMEAREIMLSPHWQESWANQIKVGIEYVLAHVALSRVQYEALRAGGPVPPVPSWAQVAGWGPPPGKAGGEGPVDPGEDPPSGGASTAPS